MLPVTASAIRTGVADVLAAGIAAMRSSFRRGLRGSPVLPSAAEGQDLARRPSYPPGTLTARRRARAVPPAGPFVADHVLDLAEPRPKPARPGGPGPHDWLAESSPMSIPASWARVGSSASAA